MASAPAPATELGPPRTRIVVLGDAGLALAGSPILAAAGNVARQPAETTVAVFLGDNVYPSGLPEEGHPERAHAEATLLAQLRAFDPERTKVIFTPGNHDWAEGRPEGMSAVVRAEAFIQLHGAPHARVLPAGAEPGPSCVDEGGVRLTFVNSQWWLHDGAKPEAAATEIREQLLRCLDVNGPSLFASHHPPETHGVHGGYFTFRDHVFPLTRLYEWAYLPLPLVGSLYPASRALGISRQDVTNETHAAMVSELGAAMREHPPLAWLAGHEHSLQVLEGPRHARYTLVSGSASKSGPVTDADETLFALEALGFMELRFYEGDRALLVVHALEDGIVQPKFQYWLER